MPFSCCLCLHLSRAPDQGDCCGNVCQPGPGCHPASVFYYHCTEHRGMAMRLVPPNWHNQLHIFAAHGWTAQSKVAWQQHMQTAHPLCICRSYDQHCSPYCAQSGGVRIQACTCFCLQYTNQGNVSINWLVNQLRAVNTTVIALTGGMLTAFDQLSSANTQLVSKSCPHMLWLGLDMCFRLLCCSCQCCAAIVPE